MVKNLLIANIGLFALSWISPFIFDQLTLFQPFLTSESDGIVYNTNFKPWQLITYMFLHGGPGHLLSNMFGLFIFGSTLESFMGSKKFLTYYLITGVGAALINIAVTHYQLPPLSYQEVTFIIENNRAGMVGASGAIFGILVAFGVLFPNVELMLLFFPIPIKAKYFVILYGLYELYAGTAGLQQGVAHFAHIGGLITGFILLKFFGFDQRSGPGFRRWS